MEVIDLPRSSNRIMFEENGRIKTKCFSSERKFRRALIRCKDSFPFSINEIIAHEKAHIETARSLGYPAQYCLSYNGANYQPGAWINEGRIREIPIGDLIAILSNPKKLGDDDKLKLQYLRVFKRFY